MNISSCESTCSCPTSHGPTLNESTLHKPTMRKPAWRGLTWLRPAWRGLALMAVGAAFVVASQSDADAHIYGKRFTRHNAHGYVVAESWYGRGRIRGRVRPTRLGPQVRLPGGTWIYCEITCTHTLRVNTLDFWENQGQESDGIGILRSDLNY